MNDIKTLRILIADDNKYARKGLGALLSSFSRQGDPINMEIVGEAADGQEAVHMAQHLSPDLIFMDIKMPHMDGIEATRIIKEKHKDTKVVVLSMYSTQQEEAIRSGADDFIEKGTDAQKIKQVVTRFYRANRTQKEKGV